MTAESIVGLTGPVLQRWYNGFAKTRKPSTINNYLSFLNPFLIWAYEIGYLDKDYSRLLKRPKLKPYSHMHEDEQQPKEKYLTHDDAKRLLKVSIGGENALRNRAIVALFLYSGIRVS